MITFELNSLLIKDENNSHYAYIKDFNKFMCNKTKDKNEKHFFRYYLQRFSSEKVLQEHKKVSLEINVKQSVKLRSGPVKFKNYLKQLTVSFTIYPDFESVVIGAQSNDNDNNASYTKKLSKTHSMKFCLKLCMYRW